jgi:imidazole glycerol-phosphate synthase subunit HisH
MTKVGIIDYRAGNIRSIVNAFDYIGCDTVLVTEKSTLADVSHVILPGVGAFAFCMDRLVASGLIPALEEWAFVQRKPLLGICVGMQLMASMSRELGQHAGLNWLGGKVLPLGEGGVRVPHVGWNDVSFVEPFGSFAKGAAADFYFDHSYAFFEPDQGVVIGECEHGTRFSAIIRRDNVVAAQFHPEKSQDAGLKFLEGFVEMAA